MKTLGQEILEMAISESPVKTILVVYPGRFQPMGQHHAAVYKKLASRFGKTNTFVVTSDKVALIYENYHLYLAVQSYAQNYLPSPYLCLG